MSQMNTSTASSSYSKEHIPPFTAQYAQRISKIHEQREIQNRKKEDDIIHARSAIGSTFRVSGPDNSKVYSGDRTFGLVRPLSVGRQRDESAGRSGSRSTSSERLRQSNDTQISYSSVQRTMTSFDRELQAQKDIAAIEKQKLALLQVKKESYINYLKNKGNTPWIPGGEGAKYDNSLHKSVNKDALTQRQLKQAWCRSPWPSTLPRQSKDQTNSGLNDSTFLGADGGGGGGLENRSRPYGISNQSPHRKMSDFNAFSPGRNNNRADDEQDLYQSPLQQAHEQNQFPMQQNQQNKPIRAATSPQRLPGRAAGLGDVGRDRADSDLLSVYSSSAPSVASTYRSRGLSNANHAANMSMNGVNNTNSSHSNGAAPSGSNSKYVALTVRLINTAHASQKSSYGVFIVPRGCSRLEMIAHIERQFSVHNQVSDISITYRSGYSHSVTVKSLSMGTIAEIPDVNDYSSITIYLGGSTVFDSLGNIITKSADGEVLSSKLATLDKPIEEAPVPLLNRALSSRDFSYPNTNGGVNMNSGHDYDTVNGFAGTMSGFGAGGAGVSSMGASLVPGLDVGDTLQYFDGVDVTYVEDDNSTYYSEAYSMQPSVAPPVAPPPSSVATASTLPPQPVQVPMYESLHPAQKQHSFSYASPAVPLLGGQGADKVLGSPKGSYYNNAPVLTTTREANAGAGAVVNRASAYEIQSYLLDDIAKSDTTRLPGSSVDEADASGAATGTSGSRFHDEHLRQNILTKKSSFTSPYRTTPASLYSFKESAGNNGGVKVASQDFALRAAEPSVAPAEQETPRLPRDWLAEAEAEAQMRQSKQPLQQQEERKHRPLRMRETSDPATAGGGASMSAFSSPAYRASTVSSQQRLRDRPSAPTTASGRVGRSRSRSQSRSELDGAASRGRSSSAGRSRSTGRVRSHSADALSRLQPRYQQSPHQQQQQPWRPLPMPVSPGGPPLVRTTAASRGRTAFINHRAVDVAAAVDHRDTSSSRGRPRSSSAGSSRSLNGGRRIHSFSHSELPPADEVLDEVWLSDPPSSRFHNHRAHREGDEWQEQQRVQEYHSLYADHPSEAHSTGMRQPRINEGPQAGGAGDSHIDLNHHLHHADSLRGAVHETDNLMLPWSRSEEALNDPIHQEEPPRPSNSSRRGSGRSTSSGRHFAMNLDELLAEIA